RRRDPSRAARDRDFACRLPLGVASLTPPKRLKFKSARPDQFPLQTVATIGIPLPLRGIGISPVGSRSALPRSRRQNGSSSNLPVPTNFLSTLALQEGSLSRCAGSGFRLSAPARRCLAHAAKTAQGPSSPSRPLSSSNARV